MTLKKNIVANYAGMGVVALAPVLALPWYLAALGSKQFGLIAFVIMLQAVLGLFDAGMSQALVREIVVRLDTTERGQRSTAALLFGFERIYWLFAMCASCIALLLANSIATYWLKLGDTPAELGRGAIYGAAAIFAAQFPGSIYRSLLVGAQAQVKLSSLMFGGALLRHVGGVVVVTMLPTLTAYLIWQTTVALLETLMRARLAWATVGIKRNQVGWEIKELLPAWKLVISMSGSVSLGALTVQMDKIVLSRMVSIEQFGYYVIASTVGVGVLQLIYPLLQAILPRAVQLRKDPFTLRSLYVKTFRLISLMIVLGGLVFSISGERLLLFWLGDAQVVEAVYSVLSILLIGTAFNALYNIGYINWIANDKIYCVFQVNALGLALSVALIPPLVKCHGMMGAAFGWVAMNLVGLLLSLEWLKREQDE